MSGNRRFSDAIKTLDFRKDDKPLYFSGMLGTILNGVSVIHVPSRPGFVWVRLRSVTNELIQAYNSLVSPIYDLPVIVERDPLDPTRYSIIGRDVGRYDSWGAANSPAYTNPVYQTTYYPNIYNNGVYVASSGTVFDFGDNLNVVVTGSVIFVSAVDLVGGYVSVYDNATYKITGTVISYGNNLDVFVTGSTAYIDVATGVYALASHSHPAGNTYDLLIYDDHVFKATGTAIDFGTNINVAVTGSTVFVSSVDTVGEGGGSDLLIYDDSAFKVTGTALNFGSNLDVAVTGSTAFIQAVGGGFSGELPIYDSSTFKVTGTAISFDSNLTVAVTGTTAFVNGTGGGAGGDGHITIMPFSYSSITGTAWSIANNASALHQSYHSHTTAQEGAEIKYNVYFQAGTYTLLIYTHTSSGNGILDVDIDDVEIASFDMYQAGAATFNQRNVQTGIAIVSGGLKTLKLRIDGKNTGSSGYGALIGPTALWRTA